MLRCLLRVSSVAKNSCGVYTWLSASHACVEVLLPFPMLVVRNIEKRAGVRLVHVATARLPRFKLLAVERLGPTSPTVSSSAIVVCAALLTLCFFDFGTACSANCAFRFLSLPLL